MMISENFIGVWCAHVCTYQIEKKQIELQKLIMVEVAVGTYRKQTRTR